jgi:hypothetical protein
MPSETQHWSVSLGVWKGVPVHLHLSLILAAILLIGCQLGLVQGLAEESRGGTRGSLSTVVLMLMVGGSVYFAPMLAQWFGVTRPNQAIRRICLLPCGAYYEWQVDTSPQFRVRTYSIGLLANAFFLAIAVLGCTAWLSPDSQSFWRNLYPWHPQLPQWLNLEASLLTSLVWFNALMLCLRTLPLAPMDLGRLLADWGLTTFHQVPLIQRSAILFLGGITCVVTLVGASYLLVPEIGGQTYSAGIWPLVGGLVVLFAGRREYLRDVQLFLQQKMQLAEFADPDLVDSTNRFENASAYGARTVKSSDEFEFVDLNDHEPQTSWELPDPQESSWEDWMVENRASRQQARDDHAAAEEALLDEILLKVSAGGIAGLSANEREILDRVSQIYRRRREIRH